MVVSAIDALKERTGSSRQAIVKYIMAHFKVGADQKAINSRVKVALRSGVKAGTFKQVKGTGASGSFKIGEKVKADPKSPKKVVKKAPTAAKKATPKKGKPVSKLPKKSATAKPSEAKKGPVAKLKAPTVKTTPKKSAVPSKTKAPVAKKSLKPKKAAASPKKAVPAKKPAAGKKVSKKWTAYF